MTDNDSIEWEILYPFLNPTQLRILLALQDGEKHKLRDLYSAIGRGQQQVSMSLHKLIAWRLIEQRRGGPRSYTRLTRDWKTTVEAIMKRIQAYHEHKMAAIADLRDNPPKLGEPLPYFEHELSFIEAVKFHG